MPIYNGNTEIKDVFIGNVQIREIFYGNTKVYERGIPVWRFTNSNYNYVCLLGTYNTSGKLLLAPGACTQIDSITGTIGASGSKITASSLTYNYREVLSINGKQVYRYESALYDYYNILVYPGSIVGDWCFISYGDFGTPITVSNNNITFVVNGTTYTGTLDTSFGLKYFSKDGLS